MRRGLTRCSCASSASLSRGSNCYSSSVNLSSTSLFWGRFSRRDGKIDGDWHHEFVYSSSRNSYFLSGVLGQLADKVKDAAKQITQHTQQQPKGGSGGGGGGGGFFGNMMGGGLSNMMLEMMKHCEEAHAKDIARQMGINLKSVNFQRDSLNASKVKAYIDAPNATTEQVKLLAARVEEECPMARMNAKTKQFNVEWTKK